MIVLKRLNKYIMCALAISIAACNTDAPKQDVVILKDTTATEEVVKELGFDIVKEYPHDAAAFTEGLEFHDGVFYEGTGEYGKSDVRKTELETGKVIAKKSMSADYFGEGITLLNGKIYQLTYKEHKGFVYDAATLKQLATFTVNTPESWGLTNDGKYLIFNDGSNVFHYMDPETFKIVKDLNVTDQYGPVNELNEPEMINGYIYANRWQTDYIYKIDTATGKVVARFDMSTLRQRGNIPPMQGRRGEPEVLNGIAYDAKANKIYVTGKNWPKLFEVKLDN